MVALDLHRQDCLFILIQRDVKANQPYHRTFVHQCQYRKCQYRNYLGVRFKILRHSGSGIPGKGR
jgi:hypothetical protein